MDLKKLVKFSVRQNGVVGRHCKKGGVHAALDKGALVCAVRSKKSFAQPQILQNLVRLVCLPWCVICVASD